MHKFHSVLRCWACISGPLGLKKEGSKEKIDEGLVQLKSPQCVAHLSFWLTKLSLDKFNSPVLQMTFWTFDGDHVLHNSEKKVIHNHPQMSFSPSLGRPLWWWWGRTPIASGHTCPASHQPPPSLPGLKFQFGKIVMARKYGEEENWLAQ